MRTFRGSGRTDLASEIVRTRPKKLGGDISRTDVTLSEHDSVRLGKPAGRYTTVSSRAAADGDRELYPRLIAALGSAIGEYAAGARTTLVVGLGNPAMTADALGSAVVKRVRVTRDGGEGVCTLAPNVLGVTGIESFDVVKGAADRISPDLIIAVDSLCAAASDRLATAFQVSDAGITPGSGVSNFRYRIDRAAMGTRVVSVGVPLVVYASTLVREASGRSGESELIVTPKDIDAIVEDCAYIIAAAIDKAMESN